MILVSPTLFFRGAGECLGIEVPKIFTCSFSTGVVGSLLWDIPRLGRSYQTFSVTMPEVQASIGELILLALEDVALR